SLHHARSPSRARASPPLHFVTRPLDRSSGCAVPICCDDENHKKMWVDRSEPVEVPLPSTAGRFPLVPTDISGVLNTSPTESPGVCLHYVKRGLRTQKLKRATPERPIHFNTTAGVQDSGSLCQGQKAQQRNLRGRADGSPDEVVGCN